jgi:predicted DNA-binding transcriptional regulator AlpA
MRKPPADIGSRQGQESGIPELFAVPRLEELVANPDKIGVLDGRTARALKTQAIAALNLLHGLAVECSHTAGDGPDRRRRDRLLNVAEAGDKLGVRPDWLYRHHRNLPFTVRHGRLLRFSELGIEEYIRRRVG